MTSSTNKEVYLTAVTTDFEPGDYIYIQTSPMHLFFGNVESSSPAEIVVKMNFGSTFVFNEDSDPSLETLLTQIGKPLDVNNIYENDILSRPAKNAAGERIREYAKIVGTYGDWGIEVKFLNGMAPGENYTYASDVHSTLEEKMILWELEG